MEFETFKTTATLLENSPLDFFTLFYQNLLRYPEIRGSYTSDELQEKLVKFKLVLKIALESHCQKKALIKALKPFYDVELFYQHNALVSQAWSKSLKSCLKSSYWSIEIEKSWSDFYMLIVNLIIEMEQEKSSIYYALQGLARPMNLLKLKALNQRAV